MRKSFWIIALLFAAIGAPNAHAQVTFTFSFTNTPGVGNQLGGTVTGEIIGLNNNEADQTPQIIIESFPAAFDGIMAGVSSDPVDWNEGVSYDIFTVLNGQITAANFFATEYVNGGPYNGNYIYFAINDTSDESELGVEPAAITVINNGGLMGADLTPTLTPEPTSMVLFGTGLLAMCRIMRKREAFGK